MKKRLYFYSPRSTAFKVLKNHLYINTTPLYVTEYIREHKPDLLPALCWQKIDFFSRTQDYLVEYINTNQIDILCVSLYIWNVTELETMRNIKRRVDHDFKIIVGGPSCDAYFDDQYLDRHPDIDYAVFAQGEQAFADIMAWEILQEPLNVLKSKNICWREADRVRKSQFKFVKPGHSSPYLNNRDLLQQIINDPMHQGYVFILPYETSKGCPHSCSFCDWTAGLTHQAGHRKFDIEAELDLLGSLGLVTFHPSDANFGQHPQDLDVARTMARLKREKGYDFFIRDSNLSKTKKHQAFQALEILLEANIIKKAKFAVQDTNTAVLANVDRPDMPWPQHKKYIMAIRDRFPHIDCEIELITGLPGQTRQSWQQTLLDVEGFVTACYPWMLLPNAPVGYDADYRQRMGIQTRELKLSPTQPHEHDIVITETYSYNFRDYCYFTLLSTLLSWNFLERFSPRQILFDRINTDPDLENTLDQIQTAFVDKRPEDLIVSVKKFILELFAHNQDWPMETLQAFYDFRDRFDTARSPRFWTDTRPTHIGP